MIHTRVECDKKGQILSDSDIIWTALFFNLNQLFILHIYFYMVFYIYIILLFFIK